MSIPYSANRHAQLGTLTPPAEGFAGSHATASAALTRDEVPRRRRGRLARMGARPSEGARDRLRSDALRGIYGGGAPGASRPLGREKPPSRPRTGREKRAQAAPLEDSLPAGARRLRGRTAPSRILPRASLGRALAHETRPMAPEGRPRVGPQGPTAPAHGTAPGRRSPCARARAGCPLPGARMPSRAAPGRRSREGIRNACSGPRGPRAAPLQDVAPGRAMRVPRTRCGRAAAAAGAATPEKAPRCRPQTGAERCTLAPRCRRAAPGRRSRWRRGPRARSAPEVDTFSR